MALLRIEEKIIQTFKKKSIDKIETNINNSNEKSSKKEISLLLNILNTSFDYSKLENIDKIYIPLKYWTNENYKNIINILSNKSNLYIYMPNILRDEHKSLIYTKIEEIVKSYDIKGFVVSNLAQIDLLKKYKDEAEEKTQSGLILAASAQEKPEMSEVVAVGPGTEENPMTVSVGDKVIISKYSGTQVKLDGVEYTISEIKDILAVVE